MAVSGAQLTRIGTGMAVGIAITILAKGVGGLEVNGTPQLQNLTSAGVVPIVDFVTGTPQLQNLTSAGVIPIGQTVTGTGQLQNLTSSGIVASGTPSVSGSVGGNRKLTATSINRALAYNGLNRRLSFKGKNRKLT